MSHDHPSHVTTQPFIARWASWYFLEIASTTITAGCAGYLHGVGATDHVVGSVAASVLMGLAPLPIALIAAQEAVRVTRNAIHRAERRDRQRAAAAEAEAIRRAAEYHADTEGVADHVDR